MRIEPIDRIRAGSAVGAPQPPLHVEEPAEGKSFGEFLGEALGGVNAAQSNSASMVQRFASGERLDIHDVMIAMEQASTAMALTVQVRNKLVEAYQEVMRTQV
ncbi:MAG: flagellar hook-basal body complex protein FliE [Chthonomonadales bacterium]|nr:flagellar hook-basal body complex protein FliE [Chthonomonadales bacterium]